MLHLLKFSIGRQVSNLKQNIKLDKQSGLSFINTVHLTLNYQVSIVPTSENFKCIQGGIIYHQFLSWIITQWILYITINYIPCIILKQVIWIFTVMYHQHLNLDLGNLQPHDCVTMGDYETDSYFKCNSLCSTLHWEEEILVFKQGIYTCWMMDGMLPSLGNLTQRKTVSRKVIWQFYWLRECI